MKYIAEQDIIQSWSKLIESNESNRSQLNKFFGLLEVLKHLNIEPNGVITSGIQYHLNSSSLSEELQGKYFLISSVLSFKFSYHFSSLSSWALI